MIESDDQTKDNEPKYDVEIQLQRERKTQAHKWKHKLNDIKNFFYAIINANGSVKLCKRTVDILMCRFDDDDDFISIHLH